MKDELCILCVVGITLIMAVLGISGIVSWIVILIALGIGVIAYSFTTSIMAAAVTSSASIIVTMILMRFGPFNEGFNTRTPPSEISAIVKKMVSKKEGFADVSSDDVMKVMNTLKQFKKNENFMNITRNIAEAGYGTPGFGIGAPLVEGYEDVKKEKDEKPAPASKEEKKTKAKGKKEMPAPFTLGEIPSQAKNGPHIDAGSTLIKAIQGLNPDQINAMTKDTKQLIDTQKSLMGMLGTMKPMLNDGKQLMETFQEMFGNE